MILDKPAPSLGAHLINKVKSDLFDASGSVLSEHL